MLSRIISAVFMRYKLICLRLHTGQLRGQHKSVKIIIMKNTWHIHQILISSLVYIHTEVGIN